MLLRAVVASTATTIACYDLLVYSTVTDWCSRNHFSESGLFGRDLASFGGLTRSILSRDRWVPPSLAIVRPDGLQNGACRDLYADERGAGPPRSRGTER
jgi:hypothetical protein